LHNKLQSQNKYGFKISENNLNTLPADAPSPARTLAKRILYESRRRTLKEWLGLYNPETKRIHGKFYGIGAWTHRMAHQNPNTANIPRDDKLFGKEMRSLWRAARNRLLVGVDADAIQFRVAAHYINDPELVRKIVEGKKSDGTDPHSYNKRVIGDFCQSRDASKRTLFSLILGGGIPKLAEILKCSKEQAEQGRDNLYREYPGLVRLKNEIVVDDAKRGWFEGFDGRKVVIPGDTFSERKHLCSSGYLQNGEAVVMKHACILWHSMLQDDPELKEFIWFIVNFVHDEWQTEVKNNMQLAVRVAKTQADSLRLTGEALNLRCPMAGTYWSDDHHDYTIGTNWSQTH
jgi:DNA polymerase-1